MGGQDKTHPKGLLNWSWRGTYVQLQEEEEKNACPCSCLDSSTQKCTWNTFNSKLQPCQEGEE